VHEARKAGSSRRVTLKHMIPKQAEHLLHSGRTAQLGPAKENHRQEQAKYDEDDARESDEDREQRYAHF
jgi:hypothetical protein